MSEIVIQNRPELSSTQLLQLKEIYFESSSRKTFASEEDKENFYGKYLGFYQKHFPEFFWVASSEQRVLGYVAGAPRTDLPSLYEIQPHLKTFQQFYQEFPAHLHINLHAEARGLGLGSKLLIELEKQFQQNGITGLHIMTGPDARNKNFYSRLGFDFEVTLEFQGNPILFMGKKLNRG